MMEKSGCLQLTQEEYTSIRKYLDGSDTVMEKTGAAVVDRYLASGMSMADVVAMLDSGEYRIVES